MAMNKDKTSAILNQFKSEKIKNETALAKVTGSGSATAAAATATASTKNTDKTAGAITIKNTADKRKVPAFTKVQALKMGNRGAEIIVFSFGSGGNDEQQRCPNFVLELGKTQKIDIMNFDFAMEGPTLEIISQNIHKYCYNQALDKNLEGLIVHGLDLALKAGKKVILMNHMSPKLPECIYDFCKKNIHLIGKQLEVVGSYFQDIPVFLYNVKVLNLPTLEKVNDILDAAFGKWRNRDDKTLGQNAYNVFATKELEKWRDEYIKIGILHRNLKSIPAEAFFNQNYKPEPIIGLSDSELKEYQAAVTARAKANQDQDPFSEISALLKQGEEGVKSAIERIQEKKAILKLVDKFGRTIMHVAIINNPSDSTVFIDYLASLKEVDLSARNKDNWTALSYIPWNSGPNTARKLIELGVHKAHSKEELQEIAKSAREFRGTDLSDIISGCIEGIAVQSAAKPKA